MYTLIFYLFFFFGFILIFTGFLTAKKRILDIFRKKKRQNKQTMAHKPIHANKVNGDNHLYNN